MQPAAIFRDREHAGRMLAKALTASKIAPGALVLGLPRGGVPVAYEVARALNADLDIFLVRKLGFPGQEELAIGAIASGGVRVLNQQLIEELRVSPALIDHIAAREGKELDRREEAYRRGRQPLRIRGRTVVLVDDGLATGATMKAAAEALRMQGPERTIIAVPLGAIDTCEQLKRYADEVLCLATPEPFRAVGIWYADFSQISDAEVQRLLHEAGTHTASG